MVNAEESSRFAGMPVVTYSKHTRLIKAAAQLLKLPVAATATALVLLHRYMRATELQQVDNVALVTLSLILERLSPRHMDAT